MVAVSPDGRHVYVAGGVGALSQLAVFRRGPGGALVQVAGKSGCFLARGYGGGGSKSKCAAWRAMETPSALAFSPDGRHLYVAAPNSFAVDAFRRNPSTGALAQIGCVSSGSGAFCRRVGGLRGARAVAVSPDGRHVYVAAARGVHVLVRNPASGKLAPDSLLPLRGAASPAAVAISRDGRSVYVAGSRGLAALVRNTTTGRVSQQTRGPGCFSQGGADPACAHAIALSGPASLALSPDGRDLYVASTTSSAVAVFDRDPATGALSRAGCVNAAGSAGCARGRALVSASSIAVSGDGLSVYVASAHRTGGGLGVFRATGRPVR